MLENHKLADILAKFETKIDCFLKENNLNEIKKYVPTSTYNYLKSEKGQLIIKKIRESQLGRH